jgi:solute carrier family 50 protein (sugar transporter)
MVLSTAPLVFSLILQSSGFPTMMSIVKEKTTGERSALPYVAMLANCSVWTVYGALRADATCMLVNGLGAAFGSLYTLTFALNTQQPMRAYFALLAAVVGGASGAAWLFEQAAAAPIGILGATACMVMLASPLATVREVLTSRSTASMPFAMTVAGFFNAMRCVCAALSGSSFFRFLRARTRASRMVSCIMPHGAVACFVTLDWCLDVLSLSHTHK